MRADQYLVKHGYFDSRSKAQAAIKAGKVSVDGRIVRKTSDLIKDGQSIKAEAEHPWVSRGGLKLAGALKLFNVDVKGRVCLDIGASTGGFTDVLLSNGARKVYAVDVGRDQLHPILQSDPRVISLEQTDARTLEVNMFLPRPNLLVCDASFISLAKVIEKPLAIIGEGGEAILLFKPQFEVGKKNIGKGGIVKSERIAKSAFDTFQLWVKTQGWRIKGSGPSPIKGGDGNAEYLLSLVKTFTP